MMTMMSRSDEQIQPRHLHLDHDPHQQHLLWPNTKTPLHDHLAADSYNEMQRARHRQGWNNHMSQTTKMPNSFECAAAEIQIGEFLEKGDYNVK